MDDAKHTREPNLLDRSGREAERVFMRAPGGPSLAYRRSGEGPPVVLLHGMLTTLEDMTIALGGPLAPDHEVIAFDRPGYGRSEARRLVDAGVWRQAGHLLAALEALGVRRPVLVGHSFGASVALAMAVRSPEAVAGVVALAPLARPEARPEPLLFGPRSAPFLGDLLSSASHALNDRALLPLLWRAMYLPQSLPKEVEERFPFTLAGSSQSMARLGEDAMFAGADMALLAASAPFCRVPVSIMGGDRDLVVRNGLNGRMLAALMPCARFTALPGLGHMIHHFAPETVAAAARRLTAAR